MSILQSDVAPPPRLSDGTADSPASPSSLQLHIQTQSTRAADNMTINTLSQDGVQRQQMPCLTKASPYNRLSLSSNNHKSAVEHCRFASKPEFSNPAVVACKTQYKGTFPRIIENVLKTKLKFIYSKCSEFA